MLSKSDNNELKKKAIKGVSWNALSSIINQTSIFIFGILMARLLAPSDFGLVGMVVVITGFANILQDMGFNIALIQKKDVNQDHYSSVFWFNICLGLFLMILLIIFTPAVAKFYGEPELNKIMPIMTLGYLINACSMVHFARLKKSLRFKQISKARILSGIVSGVVGVSLALIGYGVWALVIQNLTAVSILCIFYWSQNKWKPDFTIKKKALADLYKFSIYMFGSKSLQYWVKKFDNLLIGKFLGAQELGFYSKSYRFLFAPSKAIKSNISSVAISAFSIIQDDKELITKSTKLLTKLSAFIIFPIMIPVAFFSEDFVLGLLGEKWAPMVPMLSIFALSSLFVSILFPGSVYIALGRTDLQFKVNLFSKFITVVVVVLALKKGILAIAIAAAIGISFDWILQMFIAGRLINLNLIQLFKPVIPFFLFASILSFSVYFVFNKYDIIANHSIAFIAQMIIVGISYLILCIVLKPHSYKEIIKLIKSNIPSINNIPLLNKIINL